MSTYASKYRIVAKDNKALSFVVNTIFTNDVRTAHTIADALRETHYSVEVWLWTRKQRKEMTDEGYRWLAGYVMTAI